MILEILAYYCILFTFSVLIYWPFINHYKQGPFIQRTKPYITGLKFGLSGALFTISAIHLATGLMVNTRIITVLFSGLLAGPIALLLSGLIMGISRLFMPDLTTVTFLINLNFIVLVIILFFVTRKHELNAQTVFKYFWFCFIEMSIVLTIGLFYNGKGIIYIFLYAWFTIFTFYSIFIVLNRIKKSSDTVQETNYLQRTDYSTQLPNNFAFEKYIQSLLKKKTIFNLLLIDIQDLKMINANYGYQVGDSIIKQLALILQEYASKNDASIYRTSGEEFILVIKNVAPAVAIMEANNLITAIAKHPFERKQYASLHISVSIGLCSSPDNGKDLQGLVKNLIISQQRAKTNFPISYFHSNNLK